MIRHNGKNNGKHNGSLATIDETEHASHHRHKGRPAKSYIETPVKPKTGTVRIHRTERKQPLIKIKKTSGTFEDRLDLPEIYGATYVTLIPRDPHCLFAYWEISASSIEELKQRMGDKFNGAAYTLRLYDVTYVDFNGVNANWWADHDELFMQNRYIYPVNDNATYCAEIGVRTYNGEFFALARSNFAATPRANVSTRNDLIWKEAQDDWGGDIFINVKLFDRKSRAALNARTNWQINTSRVTLSKGDLQKYYTDRRSLGSQLKMLTKIFEQNTNGVKIINGEVYIESSLIPALMKKNMLKYTSIGSSDELIKPQKENFPFEIEMELTVKGKTEAGAAVYLGGKPVQMNNDGTFTLKYKLGDDFLPFNFAAVSKEKGLIKKIRTSVLRSKTEHET